MKEKAILIISILLLLMGVAGCGHFRPIYERADTKEDGITVNIEGVIYKMYPQLKWDVHPGDEIIGYAGTRHTYITSAKGDTERNFIYLEDLGTSMYYRPLHRTDKKIPEPSAEIVDKICWSEYDFSGNKSKLTSNWVTDKKVIATLFNTLDTNYRTNNYTFFEDYCADITCYSEEVPGAYYELDLGFNNGKLICGTREEGYVEVPIELLEQIAGHKIDLSVLKPEKEV